MKNCKIIFACINAVVIMSIGLKSHAMKCTEFCKPCEINGSTCKQYSSSPGCSNCCIKCADEEVEIDECANLSCEEGQYYYDGIELALSGKKCECRTCPSKDGAKGTSKNTSSFSGLVFQPEITKCYIPANTQMTDSTGTYTFTQDCYYSESSFEMEL